MTINSLYQNAELAQAAYTQLYKGPTIEQEANLKKEGPGGAEFSNP